jgi:hypothetical protein
MLKKISCVAMMAGLLLSPNAALAGGWHGGGGGWHGGGWGGGWHGGPGWHGGGWGWRGGGYYARPYYGWRGGYGGYGGGCWRWWYGRWVWAC